jgi:hypothetical protein
VLLIALLLAGCAQGIAGQAGAPFPAYSPDDNGARLSTAAGMAEAVGAAECNRCATGCSWEAIDTDDLVSCEAHGSKRRLRPAPGASTLGPPRVSG